MSCASADLLVARPVTGLARSKGQGCLTWTVAPVELLPRPPNPSLPSLCRQRLIGKEVSVSMEYNRKVQVSRGALKETPEVETASNWVVGSQAVVFETGGADDWVRMWCFDCACGETSPTTHSLVHAAA